MVLLDALAALRAQLPVIVSAVHVHHGLSPNADAWAAFCAAECEKRGVALALRRVQVERAPGDSLEATARTARFSALATADADAVALAHHADDQAETLLLQLLRGAGPHGLSAMPASRTAGGPALIRPLLALPRAALETYARQHDVAWIDDESNADTGLRRNFLRHEIAPRLAAAFPGYPATLVRAAAHSAEAALLLDELAALDAGDAAGSGDEAATLDRAGLAALAQRSLPRARNVLRWFLRRRGLPPPSTARLAAMLLQFVHAAPDARVRVAHAGVELGIFRGRIVVHAPAVAPFTIAWSGSRHSRCRTEFSNSKRRGARDSRRTCWRQRRSPCAGVKAASACASRSTGRAARSGGCSTTPASRRGSAHRFRSSGAATPWRPSPESASMRPCALSPTARHRRALASAAHLLTGNARRIDRRTRAAPPRSHRPHYLKR